MFDLVVNTPLKLLRIQVLSLTGTESTILLFYEHIRVRENLYLAYLLYTVTDNAFFKHVTPGLCAFSPRNLQFLSIQFPAD